MKATTKAGAVGTALGLSALALLVPTLASGNARNTGLDPVRLKPPSPVRSSRS